MKNGCSYPLPFSVKSKTNGIHTELSTSDCCDQLAVAVANLYEVGRRDVTLELGHYRSGQVRSSQVSFVSAM